MRAILNWLANYKTEHILGPLKNRIGDYIEVFSARRMYMYGR